MSGKEGQKGRINFAFCLPIMVTEIKNFIEYNILFVFIIAEDIIHLYRTFEKYNDKWY